MKKFTALALTLLLATSGTSWAAESQILHVSGHSWESGGYPPSNPGDVFTVVGILNEIEAPLVWDTANYSYTWYVRNLVSASETLFGSIRTVSYTGGDMTIYVDWLPSNHTYGVSPPNATVPSTFTDGISIYLDGNFTDFTLTFNDLTQSGSFVGSLDFVSGDVFPLLNATDGWTFGSNLANVSPTGYDLEVNGDVFLSIVSVETASWGGIKSLYK